MLYLIHHGTPVTNADTFDEPLSVAGVHQSVQLAELLERLGVNAVYTAPYRRAMDTIKHYVLRRREQGRLCRVEVRYDLCAAVLAATAEPRAMTLAEAQHYGLDRQSVHGEMPQGIETEEQFRRRVIEWFTNDFWPKYEDAPNPTAIVAGRRALSVLITYLCSKNQRAAAESTIQTMAPGAVYEFRGNGFRLELGRQLM